MSFLDKINSAWEKGKDGTQDVPLRRGIDEVFKVAQRAEEKLYEPTKTKKHEELDK